MAATDTTKGGRSGVRATLVWDPLVRIIHWGVALSIVVNSFVDGEQEVHEWVGFAALGLVGVRLLWGVIGSRPARFTAFPPNPIAALSHLRAMLQGERVIHLSHNPLGALMVYNIWTTIIVIGATGYMMGTMRFFGVGWVEEVHEIAYNWLVISIALHVGGVVLDSRRTGVPLVRAMITGRKRIPEGARTE